MTPADELRAAAEKLRTLAAEASPAPWTANRWGNVETAGYEEVAEVWPLRAKPHANADHIAAMHPGVGTALADWLDATASYYTPGPAHPTHVVHALAVARAILGSQP
ncbi:hypothetical protein ACIPY6_03050 [Streptomyces sp. NPDC090054]|uniref:hypothetical protein n=1 Tax=Streptomyces sp. NPDC090054 TaxID=3365933 RepID=UPI0037F27958